MFNNITRLIEQLVMLLFPNYLFVKKHIGDGQVLAFSSSGYSMAVKTTGLKNIWKNRFKHLYKRHNVATTQ